MHLHSPEMMYYLKMLQPMLARAPPVPQFLHLIKKGVSNTSESQNQTLRDWPKAIAVTNSDPTSQHRIDPLTDLWAQQSSPVSSRNRCILHSARNFQKLVIHAVTLSIQPKQPWNAGEFMANGEGP